MELLQLRYFKDAATLENFSEVARKNMVPQSYISKTIKRLESELGTTLFDRKGKKISLNENGKYMLEKTDAALISIDEAIAHFTKPRQANISLYIQAGSRFSSLIMADFLNYTKDIFVSCINQTSYNMPHNAYDFTFMQLMDDMHGFSFIELLDDSIAIVMKESHPLADQASIAIEDLKDQNFVAYYRGIGIRTLTDEYCHSHGIDPTIIYEVSNDTAFSYSLQTKECIGLVPSATWSLNYARGLKLVPLAVPISRKLVLAWDEKKILTNEELAFKDYVIKWFNNFKMK
ncbi:MAG: LysR family transcriptional regulator [Lachnospiraceae bacterium]|nr:LysR family transcriptional regulator [Lachnospiraceae bacterium]